MVIHCKYYDYFLCGYWLPFCFQFFLFMPSRKTNTHIAPVKNDWKKGNENKKKTVITSLHSQLCTNKNLLWKTEGKKRLPLMLNKPKLKIFIKWLVQSNTCIMHLTFSVIIHFPLKQYTCTLYAAHVVHTYHVCSTYMSQHQKQVAGPMK